MLSLSCRAIAVNACACGLSGWATVGLPESASAHICGWSGMSPRKGMPRSRHLLLAPASIQPDAVTKSVVRYTGLPSKPKISCSWPQLTHTKVLMFWTMPRIGTLTFLNRSTPRTASRKARSCGVDTMIAPVTISHCGHEDHHHSPSTSRLCVRVS
jgi:hypothetical protein